MAENVEITILDWVKLIYGGFICVSSKSSVNGKTFENVKSYIAKTENKRLLTAYNTVKNKFYFARELALNDHVFSRKE